LLRLAVAFEVFRSDWHVAAINRDSARFAAFEERRIRASINEKFPATGMHVRIEVPTHLTLRQVRAMIDADGRNVTFSSPERWIDRVTTHLNGAYRAAVLDLAPADLLVVNAVVKIRDCVAHQSPSSSNEMNAALEALADSEFARGQKRLRPSGVAAFLHARPGPLLPRRIVGFHTRLQAISERMRTMS